jgi:hypothetical protein
MPGSQKIRIVLVASIAVVLLTGVTGWWAVRGVVLGPGPEARCRGHEHFTPVTWRDSAQAMGPLAVRGCMVDDLLASHNFQGQTRAEVVGLLEEPWPTGYFRQYDLVYWLGPERGWLSIDSEWLVFRLDSLGRVADSRVVND